jgi:hypothetical protein
MEGAMTEQQDSKLLFLVVGWVLGLASHLIIEEYRRWRERRDLKLTLRSELHELQYRLALVAWQVHQRFGRLDRALLDWFRPIVIGYKGVNADPKFVAAFQSLAAVPPDQLDRDIKAAAGMFKAPAGTALVLKKYAAGFLDSRVSSLSSLDSELVSRLSEIRSQLAFINEDVDQARFYFQLTYNSSLSDGNRNRAEQSLSSVQEGAVTRCRQIVDQISKLKW